MLNTKKICITGASRGIGLEFTRQFLLKKNEVFAVVRDFNENSRIQSLLLEFPTQLNVIKADVSSEAGRKTIKDALFGKWDHLDLLINNAGIYRDRPLKIEAVSEAILEDSFRTNAIAPLLVTQSLLSLLKKGKGPKLVNISSLMGSIDDATSGRAYGYRMSKAALNMFTKTFSCDYPEIISLVLHPGWVKTDMGGEEAPTTIEESVRGMITIIENATNDKNGKFFDFEGDALQW